MDRLASVVIDTRARLTTLKGSGSVTPPHRCPGDVAPGQKPPVRREPSGYAALVLDTAHHGRATGSGGAVRSRCRVLIVAVLDAVAWDRVY